MMKTNIHCRDANGIETAHLCCKPTWSQVVLHVSGKLLWVNKLFAQLIEMQIEK